METQHVAVFEGYAKRGNAWEMLRQCLEENMTGPQHAYKVALIPTAPKAADAAGPSMPLQHSPAAPGAAVSLFLCMTFHAGIPHTSNST